MSDVASTSPPLLTVRDLTIDYVVGGRSTRALRGVSFDVADGERVALVGESGSGKTTTANAILNLLGGNAEVTGEVDFDGGSLRGLTSKQWRAIRGAKIGLVPQDPAVSLDPVRRIGDQVVDTLRLHDLVPGASRRERASNARARALELVASTGITRPEQRLDQYPHELSGGMLQRVLIAAALAAQPRLLIADEPTSALDVTVQKRVLDLLDDQVQRLGASLLFVTHDLAVAADRADRVLVFSNGEIVESGTPEQILEAPTHPYTKRLIAAAPRFRAGAGAAIRELPAAPERATVLEVRDVRKQYRVGRGRHGEQVAALDGVSLDVRAGETVALVGESGSGKTTLAKALVGITDVDAGSMKFEGTELIGLDAKAHRRVRKALTLVYQSPLASLPPHLTVAQTITEPLVNFGLASRRELPGRATELLDQVHLPREFAHRLPSELSGGQRQRVAIARAIALDPKLIVLDEPVSALDVTVQAQILELLVETQERTGVSYLFITHDLAVVREVAHRVVVLQQGTVQEIGATRDVLYSPTTEYARELTAAVPGGALREDAPVEARA
ncbi:dipeptide ABC transporter ATP-binding protein [Gulosibacter faecalis]|uniref:Dipeptide ABC transporter ATP-binding protein n=1 Tax=Gulosibacter faecalis TaxID=272240 RepID=A0ABW5UYK2_9MICO|nr:ABC transporter ATP-binding protein [Gulosibacter faecalis]